VEVLQVSMMFSRAAVTNSLMDKLAAKCRIQPKTDTNKTKADSLLERLNLMKSWR
jgi:ATP-dependent Clp protease protease subunit